MNFDCDLSDLSPDDLEPSNSMIKNENSKNRKEEEIAEISWVPSILKSLPFYDVFALHSEYTLPKEKIKGKRSLSGAFYTNLKTIYKIIKSLKTTLSDVPEEYVEQFALENYRQIIQPIIGREKDKSLKLFGGHVLKNRFSSHRDERQFLQKQVVVRAFCNRDYGTKALQAEIVQSGHKVKVFKVHYKRLLLSVVVHALGKMELFLINECRKTDIVMLNRNQVRSLLYPLLHCRKYLENEFCQIFFKMLKIVSGVVSSTLSQQEVYTFYKAIHSLLEELVVDRGINEQWKKTRAENPLDWKKRLQFQQINFTKPSHRSFLLHEIWTTKHEDDLLDLYPQTPNFTLITAFFKKCYPLQRDYFSLPSLRSRFNKIIRMSLTAILEQMNKKRNQINCPLLQLNRKQIKMVVQDVEAVEIRIMIISYYRGWVGNIAGFLAHVGDQIITFFQKKEREMRQIQHFQRIVWESLQDRHGEECQQDDERQVKCFASPAIEAILVSGWLDPEYE